MFDILPWLPNQVKALVCASGISFQEVKNSPRVREESGWQASAMAVPGRGRGNSEWPPRSWKCSQDLGVLVNADLGWVEGMRMMPAGMWQCLGCVFHVDGWDSHPEHWHTQAHGLQECGTSTIKVKLKLNLSAALCCPRLSYHGESVP